MQDRNFIDELLKTLEARKEEKDITMDFLSALLLGGLAAVEENLKENFKTEKQKNNKMRNSKKEADQQNKNEKKSIGIRIINSDLDKEMESKLNFTFNVIGIKDEKEKNEILYEISLPGFSNGDLIYKKIKTLKDENGSKIAKIVRIALDRREEIDSLNYLLKQIPEYLEVEFAFFEAKRIFRLDVVDGILIVGVKY